MNKEEFLSCLISEGFDAGYMNNGIPTIFATADDISAKIKVLEHLKKENGYTQSFGISLKREESTPLAESKEGKTK